MPSEYTKTFQQVFMKQKQIQKQKNKEQEEKFRQNLPRN
jgi:hypothetical protein